MFKALNVQMAAAVVALAVGLVLHIFLARQLGPEQFGLYSLAVAVQQIVMIAQDGGFRIVLFRERTKESSHFEYPAEKIFQIALGHMLAATAVALAISVFAAGNFRLFVAIAIAILGGSGKTLVGYISAMLLGRGAFTMEAKWQSAMRVLPAAITILVAYVLPDARSVLIALFAAQAVLLLPRFHSVPLPRPMFEFHRQSYASAFRLTLLALFTALYFRSGFIILYFANRDVSTVSYFALVHRLIDACVFMIGPVGQIVFFKLRQDASWLSGNWRRLGLLAGYLVLAAGGALVISRFSTLIVVLLGGEAYHAAGPVLAWAVWAILFMGPNYILMQSLLARGREVGSVVAVGVSAVVALPVNFILIDNNGAVGAAQALIVAEAITCLGLLAAHWVVPPGSTAAQANTFEVVADAEFLPRP